MPKRSGVDQNEAENTVFGNLGLTAEDLGGLDDRGGPDDLDDGGVERGGRNQDDQDDNRGRSRRREDDGDGRSDEDADGRNQEDEEGEEGLDDLQLRDQDDDDENVSHTRDREFDKPDVKADRNGNLINRQGQIVARAGREARLYQQSFKDRATRLQAQETAADLEGRLGQAIDIGTEALNKIETLEAQLSESSGTAKQLGLSQSETVEALQMFALGKTNPVDLLKKVLTRATVAGIDLKTLGLQTGSFDLKSLQESLLAKIDERMTPLVERQKTEKEQQQREAADNQRRDKVAAEVTGFFRQNREAQRYMPVFKQVLQNPRFKTMSLGEIWARIQLNVVRSGRSNPRNSRRSLPNGRGGGRDNPGNRDAMANLDASYKQILGGVLDDAGITQ